MFERGSLIHLTLLSVARQRPSLDESRCRAVLELLAAADVVRRRAWPAKVRADLCESQFLILVVLFSLHPCPSTPGALADYAGYTRAVIARSLRCLERRGWIARTPSRADRRMTHVRLTTPGRGASDRRLYSILRDISTLGEVLPAGELARLTRCCTRLSAQSPNVSPSSA